MTLSVQNNNPGNIRSGSGDFAQYDTPAAGIAALTHDLTLKTSGQSPVMQSRYGKDYTPTLSNVISTWAPPSENDTAGYIANVAKATGIDPNAPLSAADVPKILPAIVKQEGGSKASAYFGAASAPGTQYADAGNVMTDAQPDAGFSIAQQRALALARARAKISANTSVPSKDQLIAEQPGIAKTALDQGVQGITFGLGGRAEAALAGGVLSAINGKDFSENYKNALNYKNNGLKQEFQENPGTSIVAGLAGGLATGGLGASTAAGGALGASIRSGSAAAQVGKGIAAGAASGALYGAGSSDYGQAPEGALTGAAVGAALPVAGVALGSVKNAVAPAVSDAVKSVADLAKDFNIPLGLDQITNSKMRQYLTSASGRIPLSGGNKLADIQQQAFTDAVKKEAGLDVNNPSLQGSFDQALKDIGDKYKAATIGVDTKFDQPIKDKLQKLAENANDYLDPNLASVVNKNIDKFTGAINKDDVINGQKLHSMLSELTDNLSNTGTAQPYLSKLKATVLDAVADSDPKAAAILADANKQYAHLMTIQPLVAKSAGTEQINPALFKQAVIANMGQRSVARDGAGAYGDLAKVADLIKSKVGDSGTADRLAAISLLGAPGAVISAGNPVAAGASMLSGVIGARGYQAYNSSQRVVDAALARTGKQTLRLPAGSSAIANNVIQSKKGLRP